ASIAIIGRPVRSRRHGNPDDGSSGGQADPEDAFELVGRGLLELVVATILRWLVRPPPDEGRAMPEAVALQVVVGHLDNPFRSERLPGQVLAPVPAACCPGQTLAGGIRAAERRPLGPLAPRLPLQGPLAQQAD